MSQSAFEMQDLSTKTPAAAGAEPLPPDENTISLWTWSAASLIFLFAACLACFPRLLLFISESSSTVDRRSALTPLESFLAIQFGVWLSAISLALVLNIPSTSPPVIAPRHDALSYHPLLGSVTMASLLTSFLSYNTKDVGPLASIVFVISAVIGLWGLWTVVFATSSLISKKTGADKHTSAFLFGNKSSASVKKKFWRKEQHKQRL
ncbi:hypothetical protein BD779DRAFT_1670225 [Infundibulicybe gibba]|nr:hypothetical protein BD779DRAFT_1670225 [Infundibulicybe gibba]